MTICTVNIIQHMKHISTSTQAHVGTHTCYREGHCLLPFFLNAFRNSLKAQRLVHCITVGGHPSWQGWAPLSPQSQGEIETLEPLQVAVGNALALCPDSVSPKNVGKRRRRHWQVERCQGRPKPQTATRNPLSRAVGNATAKRRRARATLAHVYEATRDMISHRQRSDPSEGCRTQREALAGTRTQHETSPSENPPVSPPPPFYHHHLSSRMNGNVEAACNGVGRKTHCNWAMCNLPNSLHHSLSLSPSASPLPSPDVPSLLRYL